MFSEGWGLCYMHVAFLWVSPYLYSTINCSNSVLLLLFFVVYSFCFRRSVVLFCHPLSSVVSFGTIWGLYVVIMPFLRYLSLRKHAYSNILKMLPPTNENIQIKILIFFIFLLKNIDCVYSLEPPHRGGSNKYPQSMFFSRNKKNNTYPCKPQFYHIKVGFKGVKII